MRVFVWFDALYQCGTYGNIIVIANSVEEAREFLLRHDKYAYEDGDCGKQEPTELCLDFPWAFVHWPGC